MTQSWSLWMNKTALPGKIGDASKIHPIGDHEMSVYGKDH